MLTDEDRAVQGAYGSFARFPDILMVDASGRLAYRDTGRTGLPTISGEDRDPLAETVNCAGPGL